MLATSQPFPNASEQELEQIIADIDEFRTNHAPIENDAWFAGLSTKEHNRRTLGLVGGAMAYQRLVSQSERDMLSEFAYQDELTGLENRRSIEMNIDSLLSEDKEVGLLFLDVDKFKRINDTYGHDGGDNLLRDVASVLVATLRETDYVGFFSRYGGDEFIVALDLSAKDGQKRGKSEQLGTQRLVSAAERVQEAFDNYTNKHSELQKIEGFGMSIGAVLSTSGMNAKDLIRKADEKMYKNKNQLSQKVD